MMISHREQDYTRDVDITKRRDAEFAEKNAENVEGVIEKKLSVRLCDLSDLLCGSLISSAEPHQALGAYYFKSYVLSLTISSFFS
jgi:hypothetical protein